MSAQSRIKLGAVAVDDPTMTTLLQGQISAAIGAHGLWKGHLLNAISSGKCEHDAAHVEADDRCEFGKWLHQTIDAISKSAPHYAQVVELHARFHQEAARILRMVEAGNTDGAKAAMNAEYTDISGQLVQQLMAWKSE
ncbi:MAG: CZB domain-containing protein [Planctomycetes bacterium]|nr:CZB domain-containing protein [Planctomycetota bacterium]